MLTGNYKFRIKNRAQMAEIQRFLYKLGCVWAGTGDYDAVLYPDADFLFVENGKITCSSFEEMFKGVNCEEVDVDEFMSRYIVEGNTLPSVDVLMKGMTEKILATKLDTSALENWTDKHYDYNVDVSKIDTLRVDPYFVSKLWKIGSKDDSGALWHIFKTIARFGEKNTREREIKAIYAQIKRLAELEGVEL